MHRERCEEYDPKSCLDDSCFGPCSAGLVGSARRPPDASHSDETHSEVPQKSTCSPQQPRGEDAVENAVKKAADNPFKTIHKLYAVEQRNQATRSHSEAKLYVLEQRNQRIYADDHRKTWPPAPREARGSCPTSIWERPSSSS